MYTAIYVIVIFAGLAMTIREGLWSNTLTLINVIISGIVAFGFYSPLVIYLDEGMTNGQHTYWLDFAVIWALYAATMVILRITIGAASKTRMRFKYPIDNVGGPLAGFLASWVLAAFTLATVHTAPLSKDAFGTKLATSADVESDSFISSPDACWLRFVKSMSEPSVLGANSTDRFGAKGFATIYADHREKFDKATSLIVNRGS
jgi:uncharacterized membrane protein required for colicin V production